MPLLDKVLSPWLTLSTGIEFNQVTLDSRSVNAGDLFVAVVGHQQDGRNYIEAAIKKGAAAVVAESTTLGLLPNKEGVVVVGLPDLGSKLSLLGLNSYPDAAKPTLIGVTGTNGKTTVTSLCAQLLTHIGQQAGVMGTVGNGLWGQLSPSANTTSDALTVAKNLQQQAQQGATTIALEVSSHGLSQGRIAALPIKVAAYTNLSRDHLDYHGDMDSYAAAKWQLFGLSSLETAVLNIDDQYGADWHRQLQGQLRTIGYSIDGATCRGDFICAEQVKYHQQGVTATIRTSFGSGELNSPLLGSFNLANLLAAFGALLALDTPLDQLLQAATSLQPASGRMERYSRAGKATLVVDYAHTPDAIEQALAALRGHCSGKLWCVFGCGGERDKGKRPLMAAAAERGADELVITADNPRSEAFESIAEDMQLGLNSQPRLIEADRTVAVTQAFAMAAADDVILLAGKGHEDYQMVGAQRLDYNERHLAQALTEATA